MNDNWHRSSSCADGQCVEARRVDDDVQVRDSEQHVVEFSAQAWREFVEGVKRGEFDAR